MAISTSLPDLAKLSLLRRIARGVAATVVAIGFVVLLGWVLHSQTLIEVGPGWVSMKVNTAISLIGCGSALFLLSPRIDGKILSTGPGALALGLAGVPVVIGILTGLEYLLGLNLSIDELFFRDLTHAGGTHYLPGRMSPISAANFIFLGGALMLLAARRAPPLTQLLAGSSGFLSLVVLTGTSYGLETLIGKMHYTAVAIHTNFCFILLFTGILCATGEAGVMRLLTDSGTAGKVLRRLLPTAVIVPLAISSATAACERMGFVGLELGISIFSITTIVAFAGLVWWSGVFLHRSESETRKSEVRLRESLRRYSFLADAMPEIIWTATAGGSVDYFNQRWMTYTGLTLDQSKNLGWMPVVHPDDLPHCMERWHESLKSGCDYEVEYRFRRRDGVYRWHLGRAFPMRGEGGETLQWVGSCTDIDDQKRARTELEQRVTERTAELAGAREHLQAVLDSATQVAIIAIDPSGQITLFNRGAEQMFGYTAGEMIGKQTPAIFHVEWEVAARARELTMELGRPIHGIDVFVEKARQGHHEEREWTLVRKDGSQVSVNLIITAMRDSGGNITGFLGIVADISARRKAEKQLRDQALILDLANDTIVIRDINDLVTYWNQGAQRLYGWTKEEALGRITHELFQTQFSQPLSQIRAQLLETGSWRGELVHHRRDGSTVMVASSWTLQRDESGEPAAVIEANYDITARKRAEQELAMSREHLNAILEGSLDGTIVYDVIRDRKGMLQDFRFTMINPAAEKMMRQSASKLIGRPFRETFPNVVADGLYERYVRTVEENIPIDFEYESKRTDPSRWYRIAGVKLGDGLVISYTEITARKLYEKNLEDAKEHAELADRAKSDFLANMSHEIRTPMNGVIGLSGLLLDTALDPEQRTLSETIRSSAESLLSVINDILDFSKIEAGKLSFEQIDFDLRKVVEDSLEIMAGLAQGKGLELVGGVEPGTVTRLRGDPGRVHQVLTNLVGNALKFTRSGEVAVRVFAESQTEKAVFIRCEIRDTGLGIGPEVRDKLFQPFVQADSSTTRQFGGTGLGLAICKRLAESMGGKIGVESTPGQGSTFWVTMEFPRQESAAVDVPTPDDLVDTRVLVVDDNATSREFLHRHVMAWRWRNGCAASGDEALAMLRRAVEEKEPYAVALVDLQMPGMDGLGLAQRIHDDPQLCATRLILLTPIGKPIASGQSAPASLAGCCIKPVRQSALFDTIVQSLRRPAGSGVIRPPSAPAKSSAAVPARKERILLAEDNAVNQEVALGNLRKLGYHADVVANGLEVLEALQARKYDIILMDCQMPDLDGYETTQQIRQHEGEGRHTRIIAMTANAMVGDREKCLAAGMDDYVSKPLRRAELRAALDRAVPKVSAPFVESVLRSMAEDDTDELAHLIHLFVDTAPGSITAMQNAVARKDAKALTVNAHTLKGSCSNLGAVPLREICARLEESAKEGNLEGTSELVASAETELHRLGEALRSYLHPKPVS